MLRSKYLKPPKTKTGWILLVCILYITYLTLNNFGVFTHLYEKDFFKEFKYPYEGDIRMSVFQLRNNERPDIPPINEYNYPFIRNPTIKCINDDIRLVLLVKSAPENFQRRIAIRKTWGYEKRFSDVEIRTVFVIGVRNKVHLNNLVLDEFKLKKDLVIADFHDSYYNNTIKTMLGIKWASQFCGNAKFYMFVDDDYYVSVKNVLRYTRNPTKYPDFIKPFIKQINARRAIKDVEDYELANDVKLYTGYVFQSSPHRHLISKWFVSLEEYPYHKWPPYVTAGGYILSKEALLELFYTSYYTKHFRFDDIYVGLLAYKAEIAPFHCDEFYFYKKTADSVNFQFTIASHGYGDPEELVTVWNKQKGLGNA